MQVINYSWTLTSGEAEVNCYKNRENLIHPEWKEIHTFTDIKGGSSNVLIEMQFLMFE